MKYPVKVQTHFCHSSKKFKLEENVLPEDSSHGVDSRGDGAERGAENPGHKQSVHSAVRAEQFGHCQQGGGMRNWDRCEKGEVMC